MKPNFGGYATKYGVLCTDGRTIQADAFKHEDGKRVPLVWRHDDKTPTNTLGYATLEHRDGDGVYAKAYFNSTPTGSHARQMVEHGDIEQLSIKAVRLTHEGTHVVNGDLVDVSLVPFGANSEAKIDSVYIQHDGMTYERENEGYIFSGISLELAHEDSEDSDAEDAEDSEEEAVEDSEEEPDDEVEHEGDAQEVFESMNEKQQLLLALLLQRAAKGVAHEESLNHEGKNHMSRNVFDQTETNNKSEILTHEDAKSIFDSAKRLGSFKAAVLEHAEARGISNISELFPDAKNVQNTPEWVKRDDSWASSVLSGVKSLPFSRIRSRSADVTHEEARAKGYITGEMKKEAYFEVARRETTPTTVYAKRSMHRDQMLDVSDFNVVAWMMAEVRNLLIEELARAYLFGDNRDIEDPDKINESNIRPIATDDDFYTSKLLIPASLSPATVVDKLIRARRLRRGGTGRATLYTTDGWIIDMLLVKDQLGRRLYDSEAALANALGVANVVACEVLEEGYYDEDGNKLLGVLVNMTDYSVGMDRGGEVTDFEDFDIDFNVHKYLKETRRAGALTQHHSAVSIWTTNSIRVVPDEPVLADVNQIAIPEVDGVIYSRRLVGTEDVDISGTTLTITEEMSPVTIVAIPDDGYRFPVNITTEWTFDWTDE